MSVRENILRVQRDISSVCQKAGRGSKEIVLLAVIKEADITQIREALDGGISDFGGNKVQDTLKKYNALSENCCFLTALSWHMVGHLQTNKVKDAVKIFDLIHSVDSLRLAEAIDKEAKRINKVQNVLIEVNVSGESTKYGVSQDEVLDLTRKMLLLRHLRLKGLMTIAPLSDNVERSRQYFRTLRLLRDKINNEILNGNNQQLEILSMGMTQDYKVAIEEGATMVRIGRAIFKT